MLCISALFVVTSPFSFLILLIWVFSPFSLMSLANDLSIVYFLKESAFSFIDLCYCLLHSFLIYFCSDHSLLEKCRSKLQWCIISYQSEWPSSKSSQTMNAGEGLQKREPSCTVGGNANWYNSLWRTVWKFLKKLGIKLPYGPQSHYWAYTLRKP